MKDRKRYQITEYCHHFLGEYIEEGDCCIDATCGNGNDTEFLCRMVGPGGLVYGFDIQEQAVIRTRQRLCDAGFSERVRLYCAGHEYMAEYVKENAAGKVAAIMFNFGYLPGGDHSVATRAETSLAAVKAGLVFLKPGGVMSLCIYSGGDTGYEERDALLSFLRELDPKEWLVLACSYFNRKNDPPLPVFVIRL